jgi:hypothetical protein
MGKYGDGRRRYMGKNLDIYPFSSILALATSILQLHVAGYI